MTAHARVRPFGDAAVLLDLGLPTGVAAARRARALAAAVDAVRDGDARLGVPVAGAASVLVPFEPRALAPGEAAALLEPLLREAALAADAGGPPATPVAPSEHVIRVRYGGVDGPDLDAVAAAAGGSPADVIALHAGTVYEVLFLGFAPGFAYLGDVPEPLRLPRLATPRPRVPAGSVAIADAMTAVYPHASAGGWRLLGRTDHPLFDPAATPPARLRPGDRVRFEPA